MTYADEFQFVIRFRLVPTFGRGTIRRFATNASEMKKMAARNFEDLLQVRLSIAESLRGNI